MPTTRRRLSPSRVTSPIVEPMSTLAFWAVSSSSAISPLRRAARPRTYLPGSKRAGGVENTSGGAPPAEVTRLGSPPGNVTSEPSASISPIVAATPGTFWTRCRTVAGNGSGKLCPLSLTVRSTIVTSFLTLTASKISLNARLI
jgi:hypothetical protein